MPEGEARRPGTMHFSRSHPQDAELVKTGGWGGREGQKVLTFYLYLFSPICGDLSRPVVSCRVLRGNDVQKLKRQKNVHFLQ